MSYKFSQKPLSE